MGKIVLPKFSGLNASQATLQLDKSDFTGVQNIRQRPFDNWVKRQGLSFSTAQSSPIMGIFEVELDNITIPFFQSGTALTFFPDLSTIDGTFTQPSPYASTIPPISSARVVLFNVEQTMRAIQNRRIVGGVIETTWPNLIFRSDGTRYNGNTGIAVATYPATNLYSPDLTFFDAFYGFPAGTRAAQLVNAIIASCHNAVSVINWIKTISGVATVVHYDSTIFPALASTTPTNYRANLSGCKTGIQKLISIEIGATQTEVESKSGSAFTPSGCSTGIATCSISGYFDGFFDLSGCDLLDCAGNYSNCTVWNGVFTAIDSGCNYTINGLTSDINTASGKAIDVGAVINIQNGGTSFFMNIIGASLTDGYIWSGEYITATNDPRGVYVFNGTGCDISHPTITIV